MKDEQSSACFPAGTGMVKKGRPRRHRGNAGGRKLKSTGRRIEEKLEGTASGIRESGGELVYGPEQENSHILQSPVDNLYPLVSIELTPEPVVEGCVISTLSDAIRDMSSSELKALFEKILRKK